jgi:putative ABC transport system ATP-binding protein
MIELRALEKSFEVKGNRVDVIRGLDLRIARGEFVMITGRSGSGKSTLLNIVGCLDTPSSGQYLLFGRDVSALDDRALAGLRSTRIGFIFQSFNLIARNTALKNVEKPLIYLGLGKRERSARAAELLRRVGLGERLDHYPSQLSGGQQQRVAIARALVGDPDILIADEPTGNLDSTTGGEIMAMLRSLCDEGRTVVMVTHDHSLTAYASRIVNLADGRMCA